MKPLTNSTLTLKGRPSVQPVKTARLKGPKYYHQFMGDGLVTIDMQSGRTRTGKLLAVHTYELLLDESGPGEMLIFKSSIESIRHAKGGDA
jgi:hypothetical protein